MSATALANQPLTRRPVRVGFVLHVMQVAGAEVLVAETIRRLGSGIIPVVLCLDDIGPLGEEMRQEGIPVVSLERRPGFDWGCVARMAAEITERDLDVLHAHQYTPFFYAALGARLARRGTRVILTEHGRHYPDVVSWRRRWLNRLIFSRMADRITSVCEFSARALSEKDGFPASRIAIVENGIDVSRYSAAETPETSRRELGLDPHRRYIGCIARLHPVKDHRTLIEAFKAVVREVDNVNLLLVGDGPLRNDLERQVRDLSLTGRVLFLGVRADVPKVLRALNIFTLTSVSEAASITLLEAMATGLPVVVTDVGGNPELVRAGHDGFLIPRGDARKLAAAFMELLANDQLSRSMGQSGAARVRETFRLERTIARYQEMYEALRDEGPAMAPKR